MLGNQFIRNEEERRANVLTVCRCAVMKCMSSGTHYPPHTHTLTADRLSVSNLHRYVLKGPWPVRKLVAFGASAASYLKV